MKPFDRTQMTRAQRDAFGAELDAIREEVLDSRGERDRRYILRLISVQRWLSFAGRMTIFLSLAFLPQWQHAWAGWGAFLAVISLGTLGLALAKILENMEIGHNILHGQWDWMGDPEIRSDQWEWDIVCPSSQWRHSHNVVHHTWTNVLGMDRDIGYGMLRVTDEQRWHPFYLLQPFNALLMALYFEWFIALHDLQIPRLLKGKRSWSEGKKLLRETGAKTRGQVLKDYILWPLLAGPFFLYVLGANFVANILRNIWTFMIIFCGHFPAGVHHFAKDEIEGETRGDWYLRQVLGSCNIRGGSLFHVMSGNLSHQIEHHAFPDLPSNRYPEIAPRVEEICNRYGVPYNAAGLSRQFGTTVWNLLRLSLPPVRGRTAAATG